MRVLELQTERLKLKSTEKSDLEPFYDFLMRNYDFFRPWSPLYAEDYCEKKYHAERLEHLLKETEEGRTIKFLVRKYDELEKVIGTVVLSNIVRGPFLSCFLGYRIDEKENGRGFAYEAIKRVCQFAFDELKLHRIEANVIPRNKASVRVIEKLGFINEGIARQYLQINGIWEDHIHYVLLNSSVSGQN